MSQKEKILICGILPPPYFGHSAMYKILMESSFVGAFDITFLDMKFWTYAQHKKISLVKLLKLVKYLGQFIFLIAVKRPRYVLYNMSFDKMPFLKDFLFCFIGKICGRRIVIHDMGQYIRELYQSCGKVHQALIRWLLKNATACIVLGEGTKTVYEGLIEPGRLFAVPGSVEDSREGAVAGSVRDPRRDVNVLYFSYMSQSKGVLTAFQAAEKVLNNNYAIRFIFAGPVESETVQKAYDDFSRRFPTRVRHLGYIGDVDQRTAVYRDADIFIFPTLRDVFGLVLLHAMAEALPVIASREGTIPEIIKDGENGFLVPKGDDQQLAQRILQLAADPRLRADMGAANRQRYLQCYSPRVYGQNMIKAFEGIQQLFQGHKHESCACGR